MNVISRVRSDRDFYRKMACHDLEQARRYFDTDADRYACAIKRYRLWQQKLHATLSLADTRRSRLVLVKSQGGR